MLQDTAVMRFLNKMADLLILNVLFLLCSMPIITIGPAITAMYHVNLRSVRYGDGYVIKEFIKGFKQNFIQSLMAWIVTVAMAVVFYIDIMFWLQIDFGMISNIMIAVSSIFLFFYCITVLWVYPVIAKIQNKLVINIKNAAALAVGHFFPYTAVCLIIVAAVFYMVYSNLAADVVMLLIGFSLLSYILSFLFYKVFANYLKEESLGQDDLLYPEN